MSQFPQNPPPPPTPPSRAELKRQARESKAIEKANRSWFARHKILTALGAIAVLAVVAGVVNSLGSDSATPTADAVASQSPSQSVAEETSPTPEASETVEASEVPAESATPSEISNGDHIVGTDIVAGQYRAEVEDSIIPLCAVSQSDGENVLDIRTANEGSVIFTIADKAGTVASFTGCGNIALAADSLRANSEVITNGDWLVGAELAPGTYRGEVDTDAAIALGAISQTSATGEVMDIRTANEGSIVFTVKESAGSVVNFIGLKDIQKA